MAQITQGVCEEKEMKTSTADVLISNDFSWFPLEAIT